jgi:hypothetical protein
VGKPAGMASCVVAVERARVDGTARRVARGGSAVDHGRGSMAYDFRPPLLAGPQQGTRGVRTPEQCVDGEWRAWLQRPHRESASAGVAFRFYLICTSSTGLNSRFFNISSIYPKMKVVEKL